METVEIQTLHIIMKSKENLALWPFELLELKLKTHEFVLNRFEAKIIVLSHQKDSRNGTNLHVKQLKSVHILLFYLFLVYIK